MRDLIRAQLSPLLGLQLSLGLPLIPFELAPLAARLEPLLAPELLLELRLRQLRLGQLVWPLRVWGGFVGYLGHGGGGVLRCAA